MIVCHKHGAIKVTRTSYSSRNRISRPVNGTKQAVITQQHSSSEPSNIPESAQNRMLVRSAASPVGPRRRWSRTWKPSLPLHPSGPGRSKPYSKPTKREHLWAPKPWTNEKKRRKRRRRRGKGMRYLGRMKRREMGKGRERRAAKEEECEEEKEEEEKRRWTTNRRRRGGGVRRSAIFVASKLGALVVVVVFVWWEWLSFWY